MTDSKLCAGCLRGEENNAAEAWCYDCAELVCKSCSGFHKKLSPPHKVVPIEKVSSLSSTLVMLSRNCEIHNDQKIVLFCCQHDQLICGSCVSEGHQNCKPVMSVEKAAEGVQESTAVTDLEKRIDNLTQTMEKIANIYSMQISSLDERTKDFKTKVGEIRRKIISSLDKLEVDFYHEIDAKKEECSKALLKSESDIQGRNERISTWRRDMESLKRHMSDIQLFHVIKYLDAKIHNEETEFRKFKTSSTLSILNFRPAEVMPDMYDALFTFGTLSIDNIAIPTSPDLDIDQQSQSFVRSEVPNNTLSLVNSFKASKLGHRVTILRGCFVPDNKLLLCDFYSEKKVYVCSHDGSNTNTINLDYEPSDVTLYNSDTALVSLGDKGIQIIDMNTLKPRKLIKVGSNCNGITSLNGKIWVRNDKCTLTMIDIKGKVQKKITTSFNPWCICLTKDSDIYYTAFGSNDVYIVTSDGEERVVYSSFDLRFAYGITVDDHGDVYIAGCDSHNIHRLSNDGRQSDIILTENDGIKFPRGLSFNHQTKELIVVNNSGSRINIYKASRFSFKKPG